MENNVKQLIRLFELKNPNHSFSSPCQEVYRDSEFPVYCSESNNTGQVLEAGTRYMSEVRASCTRESANGTTLRGQVEIMKELGAVNSDLLGVDGDRFEETVSPKRDTLLRKGTEWNNHETETAEGPFSNVERAISAHSFFRLNAMQNRRSVAERICVVEGIHEFEHVPEEINSVDRSLLIAERETAIAEARFLKEELSSVKLERLETINTLQDLVSTIGTERDTAVAEVRVLKAELLGVRSEVMVGLEKALLEAEVKRDGAVSQGRLLRVELQEAIEEKRAAVEMTNMVQLKMETLAEQLAQTQELLKESRKNNHQILELKDTCRAIERENELLEERSQKQTNEICGLREYIRHIGDDLRRVEMVRRKLQNDILELKGNVRVFCRVRPTLPSEWPEIPKIRASSQNEICCETGGRTYRFSYDGVFGPEASQAQVYVEMASLLQSALDGYQVCILAYGQSGSGKTYTMFGDEGFEQAGLIPRAGNQIFQEMKRLERSHWKFTPKVAIFEIYNDKMVDLLSLNVGVVPSVHDNKRTGEVEYRDLQMVDVSQAEDVNSLIGVAQKRRRIAGTKIHDSSSRSHSIFYLMLQGFNSVTHETLRGCLYLVDLAGSEKSSVSGVVGTRLKETNEINTSLSALGRVFLALSTNAPHVPYRDSTLTLCLKNGIGGNSRTLMLVNLSPVNTEETLRSLRFAKRTNNCQIGVAKKRL